MFVLAALRVPVTRRGGHVGRVACVAAAATTFHCLADVSRGLVRTQQEMVFSVSVLVCEIPSLNFVGKLTLYLSILLLTVTRFNEFTNN